MARLNSPHRKELFIADFEQFPVWVWDDENEGYLPLSKSEPYTSEYGTMFIKAIFETNQRKFDGYLVGINYYYAFGLFLKNEQMIININMHSEIKSDLETIFKLLKCESFSMFPLEYKTKICVDGKGPISGKFIFENGKLSCVPDKSSFE